MRFSSRTFKLDKSTTFRWLHATESVIDIIFRHSRLPVRAFPRRSSGGQRRSIQGEREHGYADLTKDGASLEGHFFLTRTKLIYSSRRLYLCDYPLGRDVSGALFTCFIRNFKGPFSTSFNCELLGLPGGPYPVRVGLEDFFFYQPASLSSWLLLGVNISKNADINSTRNECGVFLNRQPKIWLVLSVP